MDAVGWGVDAVGWGWGMDAVGWGWGVDAVGWVVGCGCCRGGGGRMGVEGRVGVGIGVWML